MIFLKKIIRSIVVKLNTMTSAWVVPFEVWEAIDRGDWDKACHILEHNREWFPDDPELIRALCVIHWSR